MTETQTRARGNGRVRALQIIFVTAIATTLAACATTTATVDYASLDSAYQPSEVTYAAADRDLAVTVRGTPFAGFDNQRLAAKVASLMAGEPGWFRANYTATPGASARADYRVNWLFGVPASTPSRLLCDDTKPLPKVTGETSTTVAMAGLCRRDKMLSFAVASMPATVTPDDAAFATLIRATTRALLPNVDPNRDGRSREDLLP